MTQDADATRRFYTRISAFYDWLAERDERPARTAALRMLNLQPGERVLEIGFGTGRGLLAMSMAVRSSGAVHGTDISDGMARVAARRLRGAAPGARWLATVAAVPPLPYLAGRFDAVFSAFTLELFPAPSMNGILADIRRVLKPAGRFACVSMSRPTPAEPDSLAEHAYRWLHARLPHVVDCAPIDLVATLREAGFHVLEEQRLAIWTMPVSVCLAVALPRSDG